MKLIWSLLSAALSSLVFAHTAHADAPSNTPSNTTVETTLRTSRGTEAPVTVHIPSGRTPKATLVVAPGQSCNSKSLLLETFARQAIDAGYAVFRLEWSYCSQPEGRRTPHPELRDEEQDLETVLEFARQHPTTDRSRMILVGKSLGTFVAHGVFQRELGVKSAALLTPVCSYDRDENGTPLPSPTPVGEIYYPNLKSETRPVVFVPGDQDPNCSVLLLEEFLKDKPANISKIVVKGGHSWEIGDKAENEKNIRSAVAQVLKWLDSVKDTQF